MSDRPDVAALRRKLAASQRGFGPGVASFSLGSSEIDLALSGGLARGALHEVFAAATPDASAASGFTTALAVQASAHGSARPRDILWVRQRYGALEAGGLYAPGLAELGMDVSRLILADVRDAADALRAGEEGARCAVLGAVLIEVWGKPKQLDLTATRRLALAAEHSGVPLFLLRAGASPEPSACTTRWSVRPALSRPFAADAPGRPAFSVTLLRARSHASGRSWTLEWNRDRRCFDDLTPAAAPIRSEGRASDTPLSGGVVSLPAGGPAEAGSEAAQRAG
jgi:protein ImuA